MRTPLPTSFIFPLVHPPPHFFRKSISGTQHHRLLSLRWGCQSLSIVAGYWGSSWWVAWSGTARSLWHTTHFPSPSGSLWLRKLPATDRLRSVHVCLHILIIQSVLNLKDASPDASLIVGVFNGRRQMRWEVKGGASTAKGTRSSVAAA